MSNTLPYGTAVETLDGTIRVFTNQKGWFGLFLNPHTSIMPVNFADAGRLGTVILWNTIDPDQLFQLHEAIVKLVQEIGADGVAEIAKGAKLTEQAWKIAGRSGSGFQEAVKQAGQQGISFPISSEILNFIRGFK
jgi:hypothetical protein